MRKLILLACLLFSTVMFAEDKLINNPDQDGNIIFRVNDGGTPTTVLTIDGATSSLSLDGGLMTFPVGSASNPSITFTGDLDTGIYHSGANEVSIATNGTQKAIINSDGWVGLNMTPSEELSVKGGASLGTINLRNSAGSERAKIFYGGSDFGLLQLFNTSDGTGVLIRGAGDSYITGGNLGVGIASPTSRLHLYEPTGASIDLKIGNTEGTASISVDTGIIYLKNAGGDQVMWFTNASPDRTYLSRHTSGSGNRTMCWNASTEELTANDGACGTSTRDSKKDIVPLETEINPSLLYSLEPVVFTYKQQDPKDLYDRQIGFIAEDVNKVLPHVVDYKDGVPENIQYDKITALIVAEIKNLKSQNDAMKAIICEDHPEKELCK